MASTEYQLPLVNEDSKVINSRSLQKLTGAKLHEQLGHGPQIIEINNIKTAVLVGYDQYKQFEGVFHQLVSKLATFSKIFPLFEALDSVKSLSESESLEIVKMKADIEITLRKVASELPSSSPVADYLDSMMALSTALSNSSRSAPMELKNAIMNRNSEDVEVEKVSAKPTRNYIK